MTIVLGQCPLSWSEGPVYPQKQTFSGPSLTSAFDPKSPFNTTRAPPKIEIKQLGIGPVDLCQCGDKGIARSLN